MVSQEQATQTEQLQKRYHEYFASTGKNVLKFVSSLILPLMLGVFTVVITFEQQKVARQQRLEDKNESRLQREQDWNIAQSAQTAQSKAASDRYRDEVLVAYIKEIGDLLKENNGSFTPDSLTHTLARAKTLNALRQLDGSRQIHIIGFLYEAGQLTNTDQSVALDISKAKFTDINFNELKWLEDTRKISVVGVILQNCTFSNLQVININFSRAHLINVSFSSASLINVDFSSADLVNVTFSSAGLENVTFSSAELENVNFSSARLINVTFSSVRFYGYTDFRYARTTQIIFVKCIFSMVDFTSANLRGSSFHDATWRKANFFLANLQDADMTNATITDNQLHSALSIRNAKLPNETLGHGRNLVKNGDANCNISLVDQWQVQNGSIVVVASKGDRSECQFTLQSLATRAIMSQRVTLVGIWDSSIWPKSNVELRADMSSGVSIELIGKSSDGTVLNKGIINSTENKIIMELDRATRELELLVKFNTHNNKINNESIWCDNIELFINYDM